MLNKILDKMSAMFEDMLFNEALGKWCSRFWTAVILGGVVVALVVLMIGLAGKVGWILALVLLALIIIGLMSIFIAFAYAAIHLE